MLAAALLLRVLGEIAGLQPLENVLELRQHALGHFLGSRLGQVLDVLENLIEVLLRHQLIAVLLLLRRHIALVLLLGGERLEIARQRRAEIVDQTLDLLRRRPSFKRLQQRVLSCVQGALGLGQVALFDAQRRLPQLLDHGRDASREASVRSRQ